MDVPLLLLPGTLCDERLWDPLREGLAHPDVRMPLLLGADTPSAMAALLLRDAPPRFSLAGFSLGAIVALEIAAQAPDRIRRLALISGNAHPDPPESAARRHGLLRAVLDEGMGAVVERALWPHYVAASRQGDAALRALIVAMAERVGADGLRTQNGIAIHRADSRPRLAALTMPVLAIAGAEDAVCPPSRSMEIAASVPDGRAAILDGVGHFVPLEAPQALAAHLSAWLAADSTHRRSERNA